VSVSNKRRCDPTQYLEGEDHRLAQDKLNLGRGDCPQYGIELVNRVF
jgi:hypothetical protein